MKIQANTIRIGMMAASKPTAVGFPLKRGDHLVVTRVPECCWSVSALDRPRAQRASGAPRSRFDMRGLKRPGCSISAVDEASSFPSRKVGASVKWAERSDELGEQHLEMTWSFGLLFYYERSARKS